jgi:hypothetical protein
MAFFVFSCKEDDNELGLNIQPPNDKLNVVYTDTTTVIAYSQLVDSIRSDETSVSMLGSLQDPVFGRTTNSFYTQLRLSKSSYSFGENPVADSLVLTLVYDGQYGDSTSEVSLKVYEMAEKIYADSNYYSNQNFEVYSTLLAQKIFIPNYKDSVPVLGDTLIPHLRINLGELTPELVDKLLNIPADSMETNDAFQNYFHGLKVQAEPIGNPGQIIYFDLMESLSCMTLYYHNDEKDSLAFVYTINSNCARVEHFEHDYTLADPTFKAQVIDKDTTLGKNFVYIQSLGGVKTFLRFPYIKNYFNDGKIAVNEARLFLNCAGPEELFSPGKNLVLVEKTDTGFAYTDDQQEGADYFGGKYDEDDNGYWFRISMTVQQLMKSNDPDYGMEVYISGGSVNAQRSVLVGTNPAIQAFSEKRMKLVLTYTKIN